MSNPKISSLSKIIEIGDEEILLYKVEISDFIRAFCGSLFFALPLHYTMEMWARARVISHCDIALLLVGVYFLNVGYCFFTGFKEKNKRKTIWYDAAECIGVGILTSTITLFLIDQISGNIPLVLSLKIIALEAIPASIGASIARNSLGSRSAGEPDKLEETINIDLRKFLGALLGAAMIAITVAPTIEPIFIVSHTNYWQLSGIVLYSLIVSFLIVFVANFSRKKNEFGKIFSNKYFETLIGYLVSLIVSGILLWTFGYLTVDTNIHLTLSWIVVLGYATSIGGAAGRIIL